MKKSVLLRLWSYIGQYKKLLIGVFLFALIGNVISIFTPLLTGKAIDKIVGVGEVDFDGLIKIVVLLLILYAVSSLFIWLMAVTSNVAANHTIHDLRQDAFNKLNKLPLKYFDTTAHGDVISRLTNDIDAISDGLFQGITQIISAVIIIFGCFIFMMTISPLITLIVILITPLCFLIASFIAKHSSRKYREQSKLVGELNGYVEEIIGNQKIIKAFGYEDNTYEQFSEINSRLYDAGQKAQWYSSMTNPTTRLINNLAYVAVTIVGALMALAGKLSVGNIASFLTYSNQFAKPINEITAITSQIQGAIASAGRIFALLDEEEEVSDEITSNEKIKDTFLGEVDFCDVSFSYREDVPLIKHFNLHVDKGSMVAIVGPTGSGKTTLVNLLMRFYDVNSGSILIDGVNINHMDREYLRNFIGMVLQESWLFYGTVAENIAYGKSDATREEIIQASKDAMAHGFIKRLKDGYDTMIEPDGGNLSQGERQLLTIARVMLMNSSILILDEATSSIDTRSEINIQKAFKKVMKGKTSFIIAHRLSTIKEADIILVLKDGNIIEQGSHNELLEKKGFYHTLYHSQFSV